MSLSFKQYKYPNGNIDEDGKFTLETDKRIKQIGIQSIPGLKFTFNEDNNQIILGYSGIFDLDLTNIPVAINNIKIDENSFKELVSSQPQSYLIIDILYQNNE